MLIELRISKKDVNTVFLFILAPAILLQIVIEERTLFGIGGYSEFAKKRKRLFPAVW